LHDTDLAELIKIIKEEMNEFKFYIKEQAVSHHSIQIYKEIFQQRNEMPNQI